ncbi:MAG: PaaI family thioesterase [Syntrophobacteraceae bacterium]|nr:PaaI family thioesterase [Syntrophobacteraceae bacterium]
MPDLNPEYIRELITLTNASPYPEHIAMRVAAIDLDRAVIELQTGPYHLQPFGVVHGGVLATLIDTATFWAAFMRIPEDCGMVNIDLKLNYLKAVEAGVLIAEGSAIHSGKSISYAEATIYNSSRERIAHGASTLMTLKGKGLKLHSRKFLGA